MKILLLFLVSFFALADAKPYIHPAMQRAMDETEKALKSGRPFLDNEYVVIGGKRYHTGFHPKANFYMGGNFKNLEAPVELPKSFDMRKKSFSPVRGQIQGSCWAEGNVSAFELTWNFIKGTNLVFGVNDVIDCSDYGTAWSGGQLSMQYDTKAGLAYESEYRYTGKDGRCKKDIARHNPLKAAPFLRGANGGFPTEKELMAAAYKYGAMEVCGSAYALSSGGRQDTIRSGSVNHCYAYAGWLDGKEMGWLDAKYHIIKNSWGAKSSPPELNPADGDWGDDGYGYYRISTDGVTIKGSVITEIQVADTGLSLIPPVPKELKLENADIVLTVNVSETSKLDASDLQEKLKSVYGGGMK